MDVEFCVACRLRFFFLHRTTPWLLPGCCCFPRVCAALLGWAPFSCTSHHSVDLGLNGVVHTRGAKACLRPNAMESARLERMAGAYSERHNQRAGLSPFHLQTRFCPYRRIEAITPNRDKQAAHFGRNKNQQENVTGDKIKSQSKRNPGVSIQRSRKFW